MLFRQTATKHVGDGPYNDYWPLELQFVQSSSVSTLWSSVSCSASSSSSSSSSCSWLSDARRHDPHFQVVWAVLQSWVRSTGAAYRFRVCPWSVERGQRFDRERTTVASRRDRTRSRTRHGCCGGNGGCSAARLQGSIYRNWCVTAKHFISWLNELCEAWWMTHVTVA